MQQHSIRLREGLCKELHLPPWSFDEALITNHLDVPYCLHFHEAAGAEVLSVICDLGAASHLDDVETILLRLNCFDDPKLPAYFGLTPEMQHVTMRLDIALGDDSEATGITRHIEACIETAKATFF